MRDSTYPSLHSTEYNQELQHCPFAVKLDKCAGSCNTLNDLSNIEQGKIIIVKWF